MFYYCALFSKFWLNAYDVPNTLRHMWKAVSSSSKAAQIQSKVCTTTHFMSVETGNFTSYYSYPEIYFGSIQCHMYVILRTFIY